MIAAQGSAPREYNRRGMIDWIAKKRDGLELSQDEIAQLVAAYVDGRLKEYQMSAFLMAAFIRGLSDSETLALTNAMADSGERLSLPGDPSGYVDKHSTGGVGDKTTLVVVPLIAAAGARAVKLSGRGLGFTGGTVDKLESIPGFRTELSPTEFLAQVERIGCCLVGQTAQLAPADKKIYALRDVTATVDSIPLIAASIMSKKLAAGAQNIVLDVKLGRGAFMSDIGRARELADKMIAIGTGAGRKVVAYLTDMEQPLGRTIGNAIEVKEAIQTLTPGADKDARFVELCSTLAGEALSLCGKGGREAAEAALSNGSGLRKLRELIEAQGGDPTVCDDPDLLPQATIKKEVVATAEGTLASIDARALGEAAVRLGAGRKVAGEEIDHSVGFELLKTVGDRVSIGEPFAVVHAKDETTAVEAERAVLSAIEFGRSDPNPIIFERRA